MFTLSYGAQVLDRTTMYKVVIYGLLFISVGAVALASLGILAQSPLALVLSALTMVVTAHIAHTVMVWITKAPGNSESSLITALILFLICTPAAAIEDLLVLAAIAAGAVVLKYVVVYRKRHIFNPVALALFVAALLGYLGAEWWVGSRYLVPIVAVAALLVVLKVRRVELALTYILLSAAIVTIWFIDIASPIDSLIRHFISWPTLFFAGFMLTEPLGLPSTKRLQYAFAALVAVLSSIPFSVGFIHGTPELALLLGNVFTLIADRPERYSLAFMRRVTVGAGAYEYWFRAARPVHFVRGQYLEWTIPHAQPDARGIRRYFTISSRPHDAHVAFAVRHVDRQSSFKNALESLEPGGIVYAAQKAGDFTPKPGESMVWIAGGIGITPFISMIRDAEHKRETLSAVLFNCNKTVVDRMFGEELRAAEKVGVRVIDVLAEHATASENIEVGFITPAIIKRRVPDWRERRYFISGPPGLVNTYSRMLAEMGVSQGRIVTDYFPGLA